MADKKDEPKIIQEREYNIPLRRKWSSTQKYKRAKKAMRAVREFIEKHMKSEDVKLDNYVNKYVWRHGIKNPPHHVTILAKKDDKGVVYVELKGAPVKKEVKEDVKPAKKETKEEKKEEKQEPAKTQEAQIIKEVPAKEEAKEVAKPETAPVAPPKKRKPETKKAA